MIDVLRSQNIAKDIFCLSILGISLFFCSCPTPTIRKNIRLDDSGRIDIPLSSGKDAGWILIDQKDIKRYGFSTTNDRVIHYHPRGYGDIFYLQEYEHIDKIDFLAGITTLRIKNRLPLTEDKKCDWQKVKQEQLYYALKRAIDEIVNENNLSKNVGGEKDKLVEKFLLQWKKAKDFNENSGSDTVERQSLKFRLNQMIENIRNYPPGPLLNPGGRTDRAFAVRRPFSTLTVKTSTILVKGQRALCPTGHFSLFPFTILNLSETQARCLDRLSIDIGLARKSLTNAAPDDFNNADYRLMIGIGYNLMDEFALQAGDLLWFKEENSECNFQGKN